MLQIYKPNTSADVIRVPKTRTSGKNLSIDIRFINICTWSVEKSRLNREIIDDEEIANFCFLSDSRNRLLLLC